MSCCAPEEPVKRIDVTTLASDFWRSNLGADLPDYVNDGTEEISRMGPVVIGANTGSTGKLLTVAGDADIQGLIDPNGIVFSDAPVGVVTAFDSTTLGYYKIGVIGMQRVIVLMPKADVTDAVQVRQADGATVVLGADTLNKRVGIDTATPQAAFDVNGAVIHRLGVTLPNFTANGAIGTAAATVNITSVIAIAQTTAGIALTLPNPTQTQAGRLLLVANTGSQPVTVGGASVANGKMLPFLWTGTAWLPVAAGGASDDFFRSGTAAALLTPDGTADFTDTISHNGNAGFGLADPSTVAARLDVSGAEVLRPVTLTNFAANAAIGTAAATVNVASTLIIPQTTAGITVTLPSPTNTQAGRLLFVENTGTADLIIDSSKVGKGTMLPFQWSGTAWIPVAAGGSDDFFRSGTAAALLTPDGANDFTESISHNGNLGLGIADPSTVRARLDVSGAEILRPVALANFAANAVVGTAAATVDIASTLTINQTTANITVTLPNPTQPQAGRVLLILNSGTAALAVNIPGIGPQKVFAGGSLVLTWSGAAWVPNKSSPYVVPIVITGNTTLEPVKHNFEILQYGGAGAITITVPNTLPVGFHATFNQVGTGRITFVGSGGMAVVNRWSADTTAGQWAQCGISVCSATTAILSGDVV